MFCNLFIYASPCGLRFKNNHFTKMCRGSEAGSYFRLIDSCITQLKAQGPSRTCNESQEEEEGLGCRRVQGFRGAQDPRRERREGDKRLRTLRPRWPTGHRQRRGASVRSSTSRDRGGRRLCAAAAALNPRAWTLNPEPSTLNPEP